MKLFVCLTVLALSTSALARGYGMAGCGLGSILLGDKKGMMQILAATSNGIGGQTFAMSSGTSNCQDGSGKSPTVFIEANRESLARDIARGQGETVASLVSLYGCSDVEGVGQELKTNYNSIFSSEDVSAEQIELEIRTVISQGETCQELS